MNSSNQSDNTTNIEFTALNADDEDDDDFDNIHTCGAKFWGLFVDDSSDFLFGICLKKKLDLATEEMKLIKSIESITIKSPLKEFDATMVARINHSKKGDREQNEYCV